MPNNKINVVRLKKYVVKAKHGDRKALENIVFETSDYIYYYCLTLLENPDSAQDAVQDIFLILFQKIDTIENAQAFLGWIKVVTANYCKNRLAKKYKNASIDDDFDNEIMDLSEQINPEKCLEIDEICKIVNLAVNNLLPYQKECILLYYYQQMSIKQISDVLKVKEGTVKSRLYNARKSIENELKKFGLDKNTLDGIAPMACISYSLFSEAEKTSFTFSAEFISTANSVPLNAVASQQTLASIVSAFTFTAAKTFAAGKIVAIAALGVVAVGGTAAYTISHSNTQAQNINIIESTDVDGENLIGATGQIIATIPATHPPMSEHSKNMIKDFGYSDDDIRTEINFNPQADLNSDNNKNYVYDRMLNSVDYYNTIQATYYLSDDSITYYTTYCIENVKQKSKAITYNSIGTPVSYEILDGHICFSVGFDDSSTLIEYGDFDKKIAEFATDDFNKNLASELAKSNYFSKNMYEYDKSLDYSSYIKSNKRIKYSEDDGEYIWHSRGAPVRKSMQEAQYFPQNFAMQYMADFDNWKIDTIGNSFGRECFLISGTADGANNIYKFNICIDKLLGTMISLNAYDNNGNEVRTLITHKYAVDCQIDSSVYDNIQNITYPYQ